MSWPMVKLGDICDLQNGYAFKSSDYVDSSQTLSCRMSNIRPGGVFDIDYNSRFLPDDFATKYSQFMLNDGDVIIAMTDLADSPKILGVPTVVETSGRNILLNQRVGKLVIKDTSLIHFPYLKLALNYPKVREVYKRYAGGGLQINLGKADLLSVEIPLPPLAEQKRIAAILDKADAIRRKRQQAIQLADDFLRAVFLEMFGDPVTNPKGWDVKHLGEITSFENGDRSSNYPSGEDVVNSGVLFLSTKNIVADSLDLRHKQFITEEKFNQLSRGKARKGDLIITLRGTLGACCIFDCEYEKAFINAQMMIIRPAKELVAGFLHDFLVTESIKSHFQRIGQGAAVPQLTAKQFKELLIPLPTLELQLKYETIRRFVLATTVKLSGREEQDFFNSLSQKAFSGQL